MHEQEIQLVVVQLVFESKVRWQCAQVSARFIAHELIGARNGNGAIGFLLVGLVSAAAVVATAPDSEVVVARDGGDATRADKVHHFVRSTGVADEVTKAEDRIGSTLVDVCQNRLRGG